VHDYTVSGHMDLYSIYILYVQYIGSVCTVYIHFYTMSLFLLQ